MNQTDNRSSQQIYCLKSKVTVLSDDPLETQRDVQDT